MVYTHLTEMERYQVFSLTKAGHKPSFTARQRTLEVIDFTLAIEQLRQPCARRRTLRKWKLS